ncbi:39196_t:CDS:1, partial [Gigaspora margarita]
SARLRIKELLKLLATYKKKNYIVNSTPIEIDPIKDSEETNVKTNLMQEKESWALEKQAVVD